MQKYLSAKLIIAIVILSIFSCGKKDASKNIDIKKENPVKDNPEKTNVIKDYIGVGKEIIFDNGAYQLAWSSNPSSGYYKQEYLQHGDTLEKYKKLILLEMISGSMKPRDAAETKVSELKRLKASDPMVNYDLFEKDGEIMLDFILSSGKAGEGDQYIVERNVYKYKSISSNNESGVILFGVSERAYGKDVDNFLLTLKGKRFNLPDKVGAFRIPEAGISK